MSNTNKPPPWRGIVLAYNGDLIKVSKHNVTPLDLTDLFYAALEKIPDALIAMELALEKFNKNKTHE